MDWAIVGARILQSVSVTVAAGTAIWGVSAWRHEFVGKKRIELAEDVLARFYEARDAIAYIRSPLSYSGEGSTRERGSDESERQAELLDRAYVPRKRYLERQDVFNHLFPLRYRFMAQFGSDSGVAFTELNGILNDIFSAAEELIQHWKDQGHRAWSSQAEFDEHLRGMRENQAIFWDRFNRGDPIRPRLNAAVASVEEICRSVQKPSKRFGMPSFRRTSRNRIET
jgi:hypothetical protein